MPEPAPRPARAAALAGYRWSDGRSRFCRLADMPWEAAEGALAGEWRYLGPLHGAIAVPLSRVVVVVVVVVVDIDAQAARDSTASDIC